MKKYIDFDAIYQETFKMDFYTGAECRIALLSQPTADVVEVIRCEKCKHWHNKVFDPIIEKHIGECHCPQWENDYFWYETSENDFCSNGKKEQE